MYEVGVCVEGKWRERGSGERSERGKGGKSKERESVGGRWRDAESFKPPSRYPDDHQKGNERTSFILKLGALLCSLSLSLLNHHHHNEWQQNASQITFALKTVAKSEWRCGS